MSVTAAEGFVAAGVRSGHPQKRQADLAVVRSPEPAIGAAMFTVEPGACRSGRRLEASTSQLAEPQAIVINSGVANAATGERGELTRWRPPPRLRACSTSTPRTCSSSRPA